MRLPARLYRGGSDVGIVEVRLHNQNEMLGDLKGTSYEYAERWEQPTRIISLREEYEPERGDVLCFEAGEAYQVDALLEPDDITVTAEVLRLPSTKAAMYSPP